MTPRPPLFPPINSRNLVIDSGVAAYGHESATFRTLSSRLGQKVIRRGTVHIELDIERVGLRSQLRRIFPGQEGLP